MVHRLKPGSEQELVDWSKAQIAAWDDALNRRRFVTADRLFHEYETTFNAWSDRDLGDMSL
jgi:hypothetical protein